MNNKRILEILSLISINDKVIDVGCDHAYLGLLLARRGQAYIGVDISEGIIERRKKEIKNDLISFYVSDGLKDIDSSLYNLPVIAGMGTKTILKIISESDKSFDKCIIASNGKYKDLRLGMLSLGYIVDSETVIKDKEIFYNIIVFVKGTTEYSEEELFIGRNHRDLKTLYEKKSYLKNKYERILDKLPNDSEINKYYKFL